MIRTTARVLAERLIGSPLLLRRSVQGRPGQVLIFAWHNIVPEGERPAGEHSLHTDQRAFGDQLDIIAGVLPVLRLRDLLADGAPPDRPAALLTFDDAYAGALGAGADELRRRGLSATVFVAPAFLGGASFWWDAFADPGTGRLDDVLRNHAFAEWAGEDARVRAGLAAQGRAPAPLPAHAVAATEDALRAAVADGSFEVASHSWSHPAFEALDAPARAAQRARAAEWLNARFDPVPAFALPYGRGVASAAEARAPDCRAVLRIEGGWTPAPPGPFQVLPRFNVPRGLTPGGLRLRLRGLRT